MSLETRFNNKPKRSEAQDARPTTLDSPAETKLNLNPSTSKPSITNPQAPGIMLAFYTRLNSQFQLHKLKHVLSVVFGQCLDLHSLGLGLRVPKTPPTAKTGFQIAISTGSAQRILAPAGPGAPF